MWRPLLRIGLRLSAVVVAVTLLIGLLHAVRPPSDLAHFLRHTLLLSIIVAACVLGGLSFAVWLARRPERAYGWHALTTLCGGAYVLAAMPGVAGELPLPAAWRDALSSTLFAWFIIAAAYLGIHYHALRRPRLLRLLPLAAGFALALPAMSAFAVDAGALPQGVMHACYWACILLGGFTTWSTYALPYWEQRDTGSFWLLAGALCMAVAASRDGLQLLRLIPHDGLWYPYATVLPTLAFTALLLRRLLDALSESERLSHQLEARVAQREAEIARSYEELRRAEQAQAIAAERERLFGELHDGLGGTLVATLARLSNHGSEDSPVARNLRSALDDLRLTLASLPRTKPRCAPRWHRCASAWLRTARMRASPWLSILMAFRMPSNCPRRSCCTCCACCRKRPPMPCATHARVTCASRRTSSTPTARGRAWNWSWTTTAPASTR